VSTVNGDCVEVAHLPAGGIAVRDSKDKNGLILRFAAVEWGLFITGIKTRADCGPSPLSATLILNTPSKDSKTGGSPG
jgi:Domain of unknown function (DUF397)